MTGKIADIWEEAFLKSIIKVSAIVLHNLRKAHRAVPEKFIPEKFSGKLFGQFRDFRVRVVLTHTNDINA